jgi:tungstate transport system substrate-binding protein
MRRQFKHLLLLLVALLVLAGCTLGQPADSEIILATTTSTQDSGLLDELIPVFEADSGYTVKTIAVGSGQALQMGEEGNADVLLVHAPAAEQALMESGAASERLLVMHNDFVLVGPSDDPAGIAGLAAPAEALAQIAASGAPFASRADDSGTHKKEQSLWQAAAITPAGDWYLETGQGMGATLRVASEQAGYTLTDRATYLSLADTLALDILVEGDSSLLNVYHVMIVNPERWPAVNSEGAEALADFLVSDEGQALIAAFGVEQYGQPLFYADAGRSEAELGLEE